MHISHRELERLAAEVDELHHQQMKTFREETADLHVDTVRVARRNLALPAAAGGAALLALPFLGGASRIAAQELDDQTIAGYAQGIELAAVAAYESAAGVLSRPVRRVAALFRSHHQQHADSFGAVAGAKMAAGPNEKLVTALGPTLTGITDEAGALEFAFVLENQAAYTYAGALTLLQDPQYAAATSTILPIEAQHAVVLGLALGKSVADVFPTQAFESSTLGDGTDPRAGLAPATFA
jgi:rubrerythrin